jgi:FtsH-binding integral membrane protein
MSYLLLLIVLSAVTYRVGRFLILDTLIDEPRNRVLSWLEMRPTRFWSKVHDLLGCPFCITIWIAAGAVAITDIWFASVPMPVWTWLAVATGALVFWAVIDSE